MAYESLMVFTGNANPLLAHAVVRRLNIPLGHATVGKFSDGEIMVELLENVRGKDCFVLQSTCAPANDSLMEVLLMVDALKRASAARVTAVMNVIGDVKGRNCVIMDDMVDTANTLVKAAQALKDEGAARVVAYCTHPVLSGGAVERIAESRLDELVVTDSIPLSKAAQGCKKIRVLSVAGLLAETILRISNEDSVSSRFIE